MPIHLFNDKRMKLLPFASNLEGTETQADIWTLRLVDGIGLGTIHCKLLLSPVKCYTNEQIFFGYFWYWCYIFRIGFLSSGK